MLTGSVSWDLESSCSFDHFGVATWVGATCLTDVRTCLRRRFEHKEKVVAPPGIKWKYEQVGNIS